jgi:hypothetical protein
MSKRYLVIAFYENLGINKRITDYSNKDDAYEYIGGLRLCDTPYLALDTKQQKIFDLGLADGYTIEKMIAVIQEN